MNAIEEIFNTIEKQRNETFRIPKELQVSRRLFDAAFQEVRVLVWTLRGRIPVDAVPDSYSLYGVKIVPGQSSAVRLTAAEIDDPDALNRILHDRFLRQVEEHNERVLLGEASGYLG